MTPQIQSAARRLLLRIDPVIPARSDDWMTTSLRPLSAEVKEFGWDGAMRLASVRKMLATTEAELEAVLKERV